MAREEPNSLCLPLNWQIESGLGNGHNITSPFLISPCSTVYRWTKGRDWTANPLTALFYKPNHIICHRRHCCQLLTELPANPEQISASGGRVHHMYTVTVHTFSWPLLSSVASGPHSGKATYHSLTPFLFPSSSVYISLR